MPDPAPRPSGDPADLLIGTAPATEALRAQLRHLAAFDTPGRPSVPTLLLQGETGTGKGLLARLCHHAGPRAQGPFVEVNCAAIPETLLEAELFGFEPGAFTDARRAKAGLFEASSGGTLFLDEIDALPFTLQGKLLKAIEEKRVRRLGAVADQPVDVKLVAATQAELAGRVAEGRFRADLYHRLAVVVLAVPPLRERGRDAVALAQHFLAQYAEAHGLPAKRLTAGGEAWLAGYDWPGNVRELAHLMERVVLLHPTAEVDANALQRLALPGPERLVPASEPRDPARPDEAARIRETLARTGGNVVQAARLLGMSRNAMRYRMRLYSIHRPSPEAPLARAAREERAAPRPVASPAATPRIGDPEPTPAWEKRPAAVLAVDLACPQDVGLEAADQAPWPATARVVETVEETARRFDGVVLQRSPSLLIVVFGAPRAVDRLTNRAVEAALAIRLAAQEAAQRQTAPSPEVRLAVHLGQVLVDTRTTSPVARLFPVGETLALPVRLLGHCGPWDVLVSPHAGRSIGSGFALVARTLPRGTVRAEPVTVYAVAAPGTASPSARPASPFLGREPEEAILRDLLARAEAGSGQVLGVVGEPGIGKSRLLEEFRRRVAGERVSCLEGRCVPWGATVPYLPVLDLVRQQCAIAETDSLKTIVDKVRRSLAAAGMAPDDGAPYLLRLLGTSAGTEALAILNAEAIKARTFETLRQLALGASRHQPLVVAVEDLHWIDQTSEEYLATLVDSLLDAPILLLTTYRPGYQPAWLAKSFATQMSLQPLSSADSLRVMQSVWRDGPVDEPLAQRILEKAEGNPFFLEELTSAVHEQGGLGPGLTAPDTVQEVLLARIDRLPETSRRLLQTAAVLGRDFSVRLLGVIWQERGDIEAVLRELTRLEFLVRQSGGEEPGYRFKHVLTQEVAYASLLPARRETLHAAAGRALEAQYANRLEAAADRLAHHYSTAADAPKAITYLTRVAERAAGGFAHAEAVAALTEALHHAERLPAEDRDRRAVELILSLAYSRYFLGQFEDTLALLVQERERVERLRDAALAGPYYFLLSRGYTSLGDHDAAVSSAERALEEATRCGDDATRGKAFCALAVEGHWTGRPREAVEQARQAVELLERTGERYWLGQAYRALGLNYGLEGEFDRAIEMEARAYAIGEAIGNPQLQCYSMWTRGWFEAKRGDCAAGIAACQRGLERSPDPTTAAFARGFLGVVYLEQGDAARATPLLEDAVLRASRRGLRREHGWLTTFLADAYRSSGRLEEARALAHQGLEIARAGKSWPGVGRAQRTLGRIARAGGALPEAERHLREAIETFASAGARFEVGRTHLDLAEVVAAQGARDAAARHATEAREVFRALRVPRYVERVERLAGELRETRV